MADRQSRLGMRNRYQFPFFKLAPAAQVPIPQFDEVDGTLKLRAPRSSADLSLGRIDLNERAGPDQRIQSRILKSNVAIHGFAQIEELQKPDGDFFPFFDDPRQKVCGLEAELGLEFDRERYALTLGVAHAVDKMRFGHSNRGPVAAQVRKAQSEIRRDFREALVIDGADRIELKKAHHEFALFDIGQ